MYWISHVSLGVSNSFFNTLAVSDCMDDMFFNSRSVKLNFAYSGSVTVNVKRLPYHSACVELKSESTSRLKLNI